MGCFGIGGGFIWQGERQPESCSCLGFQTPRAPRFALPISSQETLYRLIWVWLESWFKKKKADSLVDKLFKKESYCAESWSQGVFQVRVDFSFSPPPPHEQSPWMLSQGAMGLSLPAGPSHWTDRQESHKPSLYCPLIFPRSPPPWNAICCLTLKLIYWHVVLCNRTH